MKKLLLLAMGSAVMLSAHAETMYCGYKDYFHLSDPSHPSIFIVGGSSDSDVYLQFVGPRGFNIYDTERCTSGHAQVTVGFDLSHYCVLDIKDGPYMNHPTVGASCSGIKYLGTTYDGIGSYSYSINLD